MQVAKQLIDANRPSDVLEGLGGGLTAFTDDAARARRRSANDDHPNSEAPDPMAIVELRSSRPDSKPLAEEHSASPAARSGDS